MKPIQPTYIFSEPAWALAGSLCFDFSFELSSDLSLIDWGTSSQIFGAKEEGLFVPFKTVLFFSKQYRS